MNLAANDHNRSAIFWCTFLALLLSHHGDLMGGDEVTLISGLRERRLFSLAERHTDEMLSQSDLSATETVTLTIEQIKTQTAAAILGDEKDRESNWNRAKKTANTFLSDNPQHPRTRLIQVQLALTHLAHGQQLRQELDAEMVQASERETVATTALNELRMANTQFNQIQRVISKEIPDQRGRTLSPDELTSVELMALNNSVRYQSAIANFNRAQLYPADDRLNRIDTINQVLESLNEVQRQTSLGQPLWWESQILQIECLRSLGKIDEAQTIAIRLAAVEDVAMPQSLQEQQLYLAIERDDKAAAIDALRNTEKIENRRPTLELARLEVALALSKKSQGTQKNDWLNRAAQLARGIESEHGGYWGRRAKLILIGDHSIVTKNDFAANPELGASSAELDLMIGLAEQAERKQRFDDAVKAYDRAAAMASSLNALPQAFSLSVRASQVLEKMEQHETAAVRFVKLARQHANYELAAAAHLRGCWNYRQTKIADAEKHPQLLQWFNDHLQLWPQSDSIPTVHIWLGEERLTHQQWSSAFQSYLAVPVTHSQFGESLERAIYCAQQWIASQPTDQQRPIAVKVTRQFQKLQTEALPDSTAHDQTVLALTEMGFRYGTLDAAEMIESLHSIVAKTRNDENSETSDTARAQLFSLLTFAPSKTEIANRLFAEISQDSRLLAVVEADISAYADRYPQRITPASKQWRLRVIEAALADPADISDSASSAWQYRKARALADLGQFSAGLEVLTTLEKTHPNDPAILMELARTLTRVHGESHFEIPLNRWRQLATRLKPYTDRWFEAKYNVALLLEKTGQVEEARKLLEYIKTIPPGWEGSKLETEFETLLNRLN